MKRIVALLQKHFGGDANKLSEWLHTKNPLLGNVQPIRMVLMGKTERLLKIMRNWKNGEMP
jgi:Protein of unknown function (DUF2384)